MPFLAGIVFVVTGLAFMLFGLFLFYAFLPLLFAFIGFDIGVLFGRWLTGSIGLIAIVLGMVAAGILAVASYSLEPYRRIMLGSSSGVLVGLSLAAGLGLEGWFVGFLNLFLILAGGLIGGVLVIYFSTFSWLSQPPLAVRALRWLGRTFFCAAGCMTVSADFGRAC